MEKRKKYRKKYHEENKERENQRNREYYQKNREKILQKIRGTKKQYMKKYWETHQVQYKEYYLKNIERIRQYNRERWQKKKNELKKRKIQSLYGENGIKCLLRDNNQCQKCHSKIHLHIHHIDWNNKNNDLENLIILCRKCHMSITHYQNKDDIPVNLRIKWFNEWMKNKPKW